MAAPKKPVKKTAATPKTSYSPWSMGATEAGKMYVRSWNNQAEYRAKKEAEKANRPAKPILPAKPARQVGKIAGTLGDLRKMNLDKTAGRKPKTILPKKKAR